MEILILFVVIWILAMFGRFFRKKQTQWDPFGHNIKWICKLKCQKCGWTKYRGWNDGDYILKEIVAKHKRCNGKVIIDGMFIEHKLSPDDEKYEKLLHKWQ